MSTRAKYFRVKQEIDNNQVKVDTDIIMKFSPTYGKYISRALTLFFGQDKTSVTIKAADRLADRALWVAQIIKRKVPNLHQIINIAQKKIVDIFVPKQQGLVKVEKERFLSIIEITLTKEPTAQQKKHVGYQLPIKVDENQVLTKAKWQEREKQRENQRKTGGDSPNRNRREYERGGQKRRGRK